MNKTALQILGIATAALVTGACAGSDPSTHHDTSAGGGNEGGQSAGASDTGGDPGTGAGGSDPGSGGMAQGGTGGGGGAGGGDMTDCTPGEQQSCYEGPSGTAEVGQCTSGHLTCDVDGSWGSQCLGQVLPATEDCSVTGDEDCDGAGCSDAVWAVQLNASGSAVIRDVVIAADGSIYLAGAVAGSVMLGGQSLSAQHAEGNALLAKLDDGGTLVWAKLFASNAFSEARAIALDAQGNLIVAGIYGPGFNPGGGVMAHAGTQDGYLARYDAAGNYQAANWLARHAVNLSITAHTGNKIPTDVAIMSNGTIAVVGKYTGHWGCSGIGCTIEGATDDTGGFVRGYSTSLIPQWSHTYDQGGLDDVTAAAPLPNGGLVAVGNNALAARVRMYAANGGSLSDFPITDARATSVAVFPNGDRLVGLAQGPSPYDLKLVRFGSNPGSWTPGLPSNQHLASVTIDTAGDIIITGSYEGGQTNLGGGALPAPSNEISGFIAKLDANFQHLWSKSLGGSGWSFGQHVIAHPNGRVLLHAFFDAGTVDFGLGPLSQTSTEPFLAMFEP